jgi:hypothetical protein
VATQDQAIALQDDENSSFWLEAYRFGRGLVWGVLVGFSFAAFWSGFGPMLGWVVCLASFSLAILIHELGHAFAAILCGWTVFVFAAGPIGLQLHNRDFAIVRRARRTEAEGFVVSAPKSAEVWTRARYAIIIAGGPSANLMLTGFAIAVANRWGHAVEPGLDLSAIAMGFACVSAAVAFSTLTPSTRPDGNADIQNLVRTLRTPEGKWSTERALGWLYALTKHKVRLRDLPLWMVDEARVEAAAAGGNFERAYDCMIIGIVLDSLPVDKLQARELLDAYRANYGPSAWLDSCDAYFTAVWEGDAERARERLWQGDAEDELQPMLLAADAAVRARSGDAQTARVLLAQMHNAVKKRSIFPDQTFGDIGRQIEALLPN